MIIIYNMHVCVYLYIYVKWEAVAVTTSIGHITPPVYMNEIKFYQSQILNVINSGDWNE